MKTRFFDEMLRAGRLMAAIVCVMGLMTACSSDDEGDGGNGGLEVLDAPKYESSAAKYVIDNEYSPYRSIELTASGDYIIRSTGYSAARPGGFNVAASRKNSVMPQPNSRFAGIGMVAGTRAYSEILYGTYTKTSDNTFHLEGFGTMTVSQDGTGNAYSLIITPEGGTPTEYKASKQNADVNSTMSNNLCRTWRITTFRMYNKLGGRTLFDESASTMEGLYNKVYEFMKKNDPDFDESDMGDIDFSEEPQKFVFTKSGTYVVYYKNSQLAVSTWKWADENKGILRYSWNPDSFDDEYVSGDVEVAFNNGNLVVTEKQSEEDYEVGWVYTCTEVK